MGAERNRWVLAGDLSGNWDAYQTIVNMAETFDAGVIQVGDLVHRGPDGDEIVADIDANRRNGDWVQLCGNHEAHYLGGPQFVHGGPESSTATQETLQRWDEEGFLHIACGVVAGEEKEPWLVTHAGLSYGFWDRIGRPEDLGLCVAELNENKISCYWGTGRLLGGGHVNLTASPVWADCTEEVYASWNYRTMPFSQVHGHSSPYSWSRGRFYSEADTKWRAKTLKESRAVTSKVGGKTVLGVDPGVGKTSWPFEPVMFEGTLVLP